MEYIACIAMSNIHSAKYDRNSLKLLFHANEYNWTTWGLKCYFKLSNNDSNKYRGISIAAQDERHHDASKKSQAKEPSGSSFEAGREVLSSSCRFLPIKYNIILPENLS